MGQTRRAALAVALVATGACSGETKSRELAEWEKPRKVAPPTPEQVAAANAAPARTVPELVLWRALATAYDKNELAADGAYKGKRIRVGGKVRQIGKDITGDPYLTMGDPLKGVNCYFDDSHTAELAKISKGASLVFEGTCDGISIGSVLLRDCRVLSDEEAIRDHPGIPTVPVGSRPKRREPTPTEASGGFLK
jgi:hypothetical protein